MIKFLNKYSLKIIYYTIIIFLIFLFVPNQEKHYLNDDITNFKENYLWKILVIISIIIYFIKIRYINKQVASLKHIIRNFIFYCFVCFFLAFLFESIITSTFLMINRLKSVGKITEVYTVVYKEKKYFYALNKKENKVISSLKFENSNLKTNIDKLKVGDTFVLNFEKGILGINYIK